MLNLVDVIEQAKTLCFDPKDFDKINVTTYDITSKEWDSRRLEPAGEWGEWVSVEDFIALTQRFLLALEVIKVMEAEDEYLD